VRARIPVLWMLLCPVLASASVVKIRVDAPIHPITAEYVVRSLERADRDGADLVVLTLDAPGGLDTSMREIIEKIVNAGTPVAAHPVGGSLMLVKSPIPELRPGLPFVLPVALGVSLIVVFLLTLVLKAHSRRSFSGREGMIGETGTARTDLSPAGKVFVHGEIWEAEADGPVRAGEKVKVVAFLEGLKVKVGKL